MHQLDPAQQVAPVARYVGFAAAVVPFCGAALWYAIAVPFMPDASTAAVVAVAVPIVGACLAVITRAGVRRGYPGWLVAVASIGALALAVPWLFVVGFGAIAISCPLFNELCLG